jgi:hypothetical protein
MKRRRRCAHCEALGAANEWTLTACADGGKRRVRVLCDPCDIKANAWALAYFRVPDAPAKLREYASTRGGA